MKEKINLNGEWRLYYYHTDSISVNEPAELCGIDCISAVVPGNVELSLAEAGIISGEMFKGMTTVENERFEEYDWWYQKEFKIDKDISGKRVFLSFGAVDCFADYYVNGIKVYESENAFMEIEFDITDYINLDSKNTVHVHIKPVVRYVFGQKFNQYMAASRVGHQTFVRKPAHSFGWDIFPRAVSAGIWRDACIVIDDGCSFEEFSYYVETATEFKAQVRFQAVINMPYSEFKKDVKVRISGVCGKSRFIAMLDMRHFKSGFLTVEIDNPQLWWPYGYGQPNIYNLTYELLTDDVIRDVGKMNMGIRTAVLKRTEGMKEDGHCFKFVINGTDIMCRGSNWVPLDAYHSRDKKKYERALKLFTDTHCNIVRVWGGGVYEQEEFYNYCDRHGIMVWQDFMMACFIVSMDEKTMNNLKQEAEWAVKSLRHHPSIVLWSGDNEIDENNALNGMRPGINKINRELLPEIVELNDVGRPYLSSSPLIPDEFFKDYKNGKDIFVERHLWGARDYFKAGFYVNSAAHFVSETGYHGCPCRSSVEKIVDSEYVWPIFNKQWSLHSSDQSGSMHRVELMANQIKQFFGFMPDNIDDFILASQISQAEAKKYFIERVRIRKPYTSGVIWWNMIDGWPQMSDAVVDYFFETKLAYEYIKRSQEPFVLMIDEMKDWNYTLVASNDTLDKKEGNYSVYDIDTEEILASGDFSIDINSNAELAKIPMMYSEKRFIVLKWEIGEKKFYNHYLCGMPEFDFEMYKKQMKKYKVLQKS